jgi:hypothetical protein
MLSIGAYGTRKPLRIGNIRETSTSSSRTIPPSRLAMKTALETFEVPRQPVDSVGDVRAETTLLRTDCGPTGQSSRVLVVSLGSRCSAIELHRPSGPVPATTKANASAASSSRAAATPWPNSTTGLPTVLPKRSTDVTMPQRRDALETVDGLRTSVTRACAGEIRPRKASRWSRLLLPTQ